MRYRPDLDGIRTLAVLAVLLSHTGIPVAQGGWMGVDIFFVLSGFLITSLLIREHKECAGISLGKFYLRRVLRLYPALLVVIIVGAAFYHTLGDGGTFAGYGKSALFAGAYIEDFVYGLTHSAHGGLGHTWSLGVEEQFYLVWPPVLVLLLRYKRDPLRWACAGAALSLLLMLLSMKRSGDGIPDLAYYLPYSRVFELLGGCALAIAVLRHPVPRLVRQGWFGGSVAALSVLLFLVASRLGRYPNFSWEAPAIALCSIAMIWHLESSTNLLRRVLGCKPLAFLGRRSYGIYLYHLPILEVMSAHLHIRRLELSLLMIVVTVIVACVSYQLVELPFLRLKSRLGSKDTTRESVGAPSVSA